MYQIKQISKLSVMMVLFMSLIMFQGKVVANEKATSRFYKAPQENKLSKRAKSFVDNALLKGDNGLQEENVFVIYFTDKNIFSTEELNIALNLPTY